MFKEITSQNYLDQALRKLNVTDAAIKELQEKYLNLRIYNFEDKSGYDLVSSARKHVKIIRISVEKNRKEINSDAIIFQKNVNAEAKRITALLEPLEDYLAKQEDDFNAEKERVKKQAEEEKKRKYQERIDKLYKLNVRFNAVNFVDGYTEGQKLKVLPIELETMPSEVFDQLIIQAEISFKEQNEEIARIKFEEERIKTEREAEAARLETLRQEQLAKEAEERRIENERLEKIRAEQEAERKCLEAIAREQVNKEAALREEQYRIDKLKEEAIRPTLVISQDQIKIEDQEPEFAEVEDYKDAKIDTFKTLEEAPSIIVMRNIVIDEESILSYIDNYFPVTQEQMRKILISIGNRIDDVIGEIIKEAINEYRHYN